MIIQGEKSRLPRSYREGRLLRLLAGDLPGHWVEQSGAGRARFVPVNGGPVIEVTERVDRKLLGHTEIAQFEASTPCPGVGAATLRIRHSGRWRRRGVKVSVIDGDEAVQELAGEIEADIPFVTAVSPLDFTRLDMRRGESAWVITVELVGAHFNSSALPLIRSYVRLQPDQRLALVDSLAALTAVIRRKG